MFVAHDIAPLSFNSLEFALVCNNLDGAVSISCIQFSKTSRAGYSLGSRIIMNPIHWTDLLNAHPCLLKLDLHVVMERIQVNSSAPWNPKTDTRALHVYCAANQEDQVNKVLISIYNKNRRWINRQTSLPEGNIFRCFPYNIQNKIALTPYRTVHLLKSNLSSAMSWLATIPFLFGECQTVISSLQSLMVLQ